MVSTKQIKSQKRAKTKTQTKLNKVVKVKNEIPKEKLEKKIKSVSSKEKKHLIDQSNTHESKKIKGSKFITPSKSVTEPVAAACLRALEQLTEHYKKKNTIFEDEQQIFVELQSIKIQNSNGNIKFVLPHSTVASTGEVCLVTPDLKKGRKPDHEPTVEHWEEILRKANVTNVKTVLPMRQLRVEYDQFELKRRLLTQHDFILVDTRVLNHVSHLLGKMFFKKHNMLIPVRINEKKDIKKDIYIGLRTVILRLNQGATSTVVIGHTGMVQKQIKENLLSLVQQLAGKFPGGEENIRSISVKLPLSLSIPLYLTLRPTKLVAVPKVIHKKPKHSVVVEGELSTILDRSVRVAPDGTVKQIYNGKTKGVQNIEESEEEEDDMETAEI